MTKEAALIIRWCISSSFGTWQYYVNSIHAHRNGL